MPINIDSFLDTRVSVTDKDKPAADCCNMDSQSRLGSKNLRIDNTFHTILRIGYSDFLKVVSKLNELLTELLIKQQGALRVVACTTGFWELAITSIEGNIAAKASGNVGTTATGWSST